MSVPPAFGIHSDWNIPRVKLFTCKKCGTKVIKGHFWFGGGNLCTKCVVKSAVVQSWKSVGCNECDSISLPMTTAVCKSCLDNWNIGDPKRENGINFKAKKVSYSFCRECGKTLEKYWKSYGICNPCYVKWHEEQRAPAIMKRFNDFRVCVEHVECRYGDRTPDKPHPCHNCCNNENSSSGTNHFEKKRGMPPKKYVSVNYDKIRMTSLEGDVKFLRNNITKLIKEKSTLLRKLEEGSPMTVAKMKDQIIEFALELKKEGTIGGFVDMRFARVKIIADRMIEYTSGLNEKGVKELWDDPITNKLVYGIVKETKKKITKIPRYCTRSEDCVSGIPEQHLYCHKCRDNLNAKGGLIANNFKRKSVIVQPRGAGKVRAHNECQQKQYLEKQYPYLTKVIKIEDAVDSIVKRKLKKDKEEHDERETLLEEIKEQVEMIIHAEKRHWDMTGELLPSAKYIKYENIKYEFSTKKSFRKVVMKFRSNNLWTRLRYKDGKCKIHISSTNLNSGRSMWMEQENVHELKFVKGNLGKILKDIEKRGSGEKKDG